jgi:hypothetical protein
VTGSSAPDTDRLCVAQGLFYCSDIPNIRFIKSTLKLAFVAEKCEYTRKSYQQLILFRQILSCIAVTGLICYSSAHQIPRNESGRIKRSAAVIRLFKADHPCPATGQPSERCPGYVIDHIIALKRGGCDDPRNMQWQTIEDAKEKDKWE